MVGAEQCACCRTVSLRSSERGTTVLLLTVLFSQGLTAATSFIAVTVEP
jgi:hypothetical protein